ncbi:type II toxin-antitoxin system PemK/MazF family toxin [Paenibacillus sp. FSL P2-0136]|uniref:type II toxin-antitoxin system PemK/MazF family toxin n=1 Tax=unclassified Paenibacillus TaxID=185978 RepID=UPI0030DC73E9
MGRGVQEEIMLILPKDIYEIYREYEQDPTDGKFRPNLVVFVDEDDVYCLPITGSSPNDPPRHKGDYWKVGIEEWREIPLKKKSWIVINQAKIVDREDIENAKYIGPLQEDDWIKVIEKTEEYEKCLEQIKNTRSVRSKNNRTTNT